MKNPEKVAEQEPKLYVKKPLLTQRCNCNVLSSSARPTVTDTTFVFALAASPYFYVT